MGWCHWWWIWLLNGGSYWIISLRIPTHMLYHILLSLGCISFQSIGMLSIIILLLAFVSSVDLYSFVLLSTWYVNILFYFDFKLHATFFASLSSLSCNTGTGEIHHDEIVLPNICYFSRGCEDWPRDLWEDTLVAILFTAWAFGYSSISSEWSFMAGMCASLFSHLGNVIAFISMQNCLI
jgi:hypothetical protein